MYDKKNHLSPNPNNNNKNPKKTPSPKKLERKTKAEIPEKKLKGTAQKRKTNRKNKITGL
jgi:hypothetical protein